MRLKTSRQCKAAARASTEVALKERRGWGKAACRGMLAEGCFTDLGSIAGYTQAHAHTHTQAHLLTRAHTASWCSSSQLFDLQGRK